MSLRAAHPEAIVGSRRWVPITDEVWPCRSPRALNGFEHGHSPICACARVDSEFSRASSRHSDRLTVTATPGEAYADWQTTPTILMTSARAGSGLASENGLKVELCSWNDRGLHPVRKDARIRPSTSRRSEQKMEKLIGMHSTLCGT